MTKSKEKKAKKEKAGQTNGNGNPFESNMDAAQEYPREINPFLKKKTKSMKKAEKQEKKRVKKEQKEKKKESNGDKQKKQKDNIVISVTQVGTGTGQPKDNGMHYQSSSGTNDSSTLPPIRTPEYESSPSEELRVSQTLDNRNAKTPQLDNKRILELKTGNQTSQTPSSTPRQEKPQVSSGLLRPQSLEVPSNPYGSNKGLSPVKEHRPSSPLASRPHLHSGGNEDIKMYRTASISKKGKDKKKKKKMKKIFKKTKIVKGKNGNLLEDQDVADTVVMRRPKTIEHLQKQVDETAASIRSSVISLVEQRNDELDKMVRGTKELEEKSHGFATVAQETRLKKQASASCCGMWKKWRVCWYICACQRGVKKKPKWEDASKNKKGDSTEAHKLLSRYSTPNPDAEDDDDYYRPVDKSNPPQQSMQTTAQINPRPLSKCSKSSDKVDSGTPSLIRSKLKNIPNKMMASLPNLIDDKSTKTSKREMESTTQRMRRSSSVGDIREVTKSWAEKRREEKERKQREKQRAKKERDIKQFASQYEDEETRNKVEDLLTLDLDSPGK